MPGATPRLSWSVIQHVWMLQGYLRPQVLSKIDLVEAAGKLGEIIHMQGLYGVLSGKPVWSYVCNVYMVSCLECLFSVLSAMAVWCLVCNICMVSCRQYLYGVLSAIFVWCLVC